MRRGSARHPVRFAARPRDSHEKMPPDTGNASIPTRNPPCAPAVYPVKVQGGAMPTTRDVSRCLVLSALAVLALASAAVALEVGQKAPDFALHGTDGKPVKLSDLTAKGPVVIYTFIAAYTPT